MCLSFPNQRGGPCGSNGSLLTPGGTHTGKGEFAGMNYFEVVAYLVVLPESGQDGRHK